MDVVIVGAGPAGLACALTLAQLVKRAQAAGEGMPDLNVAVLEKAGAWVSTVCRARWSTLGSSESCFRTSRSSVALQATGVRRGGLSAERAAGAENPHAADHAQHGFYTASLCEIVRWLGERAEELGVNLFPGFPVEALLVDGQAVRGVRTTPAGLDRTAALGQAISEATEVTGRITVLAEGTRGMLTQA